MREYYDRVKVLRDKSKFGLEPDFPINDLRIELSNICNHQCIFCANRKMTRKKGFIDEAFLKRILQEAYDIGFRGVGYYSTGEPFVSKNLKEYVRWAKKIGYQYVYITTNGAAVEFDKIKEVINAGLDSIKYSINGVDRDTYILIHGKDDFDRVIENLKRTYEYKQTLERKLNVFVSFAVTRYTEGRVEEFISKYKDYTDDIITANVINMGGYVPEVNEYLLTGSTTDFDEGMTIPCYSLWNAVIITWEGYLTACCADFQNYFIYADLKTTSIKEAWHCDVIKNLRKKHLSGDIQGTPCISCVTKQLVEWAPVVKEYASHFDRDQMFNMGDAEARIKAYKEKVARVEAFAKQLDISVVPKDYAQDTLNQIRQFQRVVLFGAGLSGMLINDFLNNNGIRPVCFCDNNKAKVGTFIHNLPVIHSLELKKVYPDALVIISCDAYREIMEQLIELGFDTEKQSVFFDPNWIRMPQGNRKFILEHVSQLEEAYRLLGDEKSRKVFTGLLNYKITYAPQYIEAVIDKNMYFDSELIAPDENGVFVDVGSYIGDTLLEYIEFCQGRYEAVICIEPDTQNIESLNEVIQENKLKNVDVYEVGVSDKRQILTFDTSSNVAARISDSGGSTIECNTLDNICLQEKYKKISFIKMDIEGSEYFALKGAEKTIKKYHPILAVCVYHKEDDFYKLPLLIKSLYPGYQLYFRQYELSSEETVCYAIPD